MPWTPWRSTSSAILNASTIDVERSSTSSRRSFGITITRVARGAQRLDARIRRLAPARSFEAERRRHDADGERAELARDLGDDRRGAGPGAAALAGRDEHHVRAAERASASGRRPPRPRVRPVSGSAPEPRPCVSSSPMWIFTGASERLSCCMSVLTATKSTWAMPASIIRLTALIPPPPTPTTLITARYEAASPADVRAAARSPASAAEAAGRRLVRRLGPRRLRLPGGEPALRRMATGSGDGLRRRSSIAAVSAAALVGVCRPGTRRRARPSPRARPRGAAPASSGLGLLGGRIEGLLLVRLVLRRHGRLGSARRRPGAAPPRSRGTARPAAPHACSRASAPCSTSFASSR